MCTCTLHTCKQNFGRAFLLKILVLLSRFLLEQEQRNDNDSVQPTQSNAPVQATNPNSSTLIDGELMFTAGLIIHLTFDLFIQYQVPFYYDIVGLPFGFIYDDINDSKIILFRLLRRHPQMMRIRKVTTNNDSILITFIILATNNTIIIINNDTDNEENESIDIIV